MTTDNAPEPLTAEEERRKAIDDLYAVFAPDVVIEAEVEAILTRIATLDAARASVTPPEGLDAAWAEVEAALPEDWRLELSAHRVGNPEAFCTATASYAYSLRHYRLNVGKARWAPFEMEHAPTPAAALRALAARLAGPSDEAAG